MKRTNLLTSRLAAKAGIRQTEALAHADDIGAAADRAIVAMIRGLLADLQRLRQFGTFYGTGYHNAVMAFRKLPDLLMRLMHDRLTKLARWGHAATTAPLAELLPFDQLQALALSEARILEDERGSKPKPGMTKLATPRRLIAKPTAAAAKLKRARQLPKPEAAKLYKQMLFPPPSAELVNSIVYGSSAGGRPWWERLQAATQLAAPEVLATTIADAYAKGKTPQQIARDLLPLVDGVRSSARRIARTEGMRIAHEVQMRAYDDLGDMVVGYQIHAVLDQNTRPEHAARNGTIYYRDPEPGQKGLDEMPRPPMEADGEVAFNCRCYLSPVLAPPQAIVRDPAKMAVFTNAQKQVVPDPVTYDDWFSRTDERRRRLAVGARRYATVQQLLGDDERPTWADFLHPETGQLLPLDALRGEGPGERATRRQDVQKLLSKRRELLVQTATFGFV